MPLFGKDEPVEEEPLVVVDEEEVAVLDDPAEPAVPEGDGPDHHVCPYCGEDDMGHFDSPIAHPGAWVFKCRSCGMFSGAEA